MAKKNFSELFDEPEPTIAEIDTSGSVPSAPAGPRPHVPNQLPRISNVPYRIAVIGEASGAQEVDQGKPFVGYSGVVLDKLLSKFGVLREACFIGNVCQHQPYGNNIATFDWSGPEIQGGLAKLTDELRSFDPNVVLLLGGSALHAFRNPNVVPKKRKTKDGFGFAFPDSIGDWRGSFFLSHPNAPLGNVKCIAAYHPAACLRQYSWMPYLAIDIHRAVKEGNSPELTLPERTLKVNLSFEETCDELDKVLESKCAVGTDIEGYWNDWKCISFAPRADYAFIVPWRNMDGSNCWDPEQEAVLLQKTVAVLADTEITKVWQNGLYDRFVLQYGYDIIVQGPNKDIMLRHWENHCELEKALGVQCSIYTKEPYYKADIKSNDKETFWRYCCRDSAVTKEIYDKLSLILSATSLAHADFNEELLNALLYMENRGLRYDKPGAVSRKAEVDDAIYELQADLDACSGYGIKTTDKALLRALVRDTMCYKRDSSSVKKDFIDDYKLAMSVLQTDAPLTKRDCGMLGILLKKSLNTKGPDLKTFFYKTLKLPTQRDPVSDAVTTNYFALLTLSKKSDHPSIKLAIAIGELRTRSQMLSISTDPDGRVRSSYNEVGSETGRITSSTSPTGSGYNLQTLPDENTIKPLGHPLRGGMRDLILADPGCLLAKCDLKGADGWTVGANLAALGEPAMLEDLKAGLKPASILCYGRRHGVGSITGVSREQLGNLCQEVKKDDWDYFAYKQCIWGFCVTGDHDVLTPDGWVAISQLQEGIPIAVWDTSQKINFEVPSRVIRQAYSGTLYGFKGSQFDLLATADHRMPYHTTTKGFRVSLAKDLSINGCQLPRSGFLEGGNTEPMARLVAAIQSDGCYNERGHLVFTFRKQRKIDRLKGLLEEFHVRYSTFESFCKRDQAKEFHFDCPNPPVFPKEAGSWMLKWTHESLKEFMMEYPYWDGSHYGENCKVIFNKSEDHMQWLATFQALTGAGYGWQGKRPTGKGSFVYRMTLNNRAFAWFSSLERYTQQATNVPVFCTTVSTGFFLVRRNNRIMVTGNCYLMGARKAVQHVFNLSEGDVVVSEADMEEAKQMLIRRYNIPLWWRATEQRLFRQPYPPKLTSPSGHTREFFDRKTEIVGQALAHEPQSITTYATNKAVYRCWTDPENRIARSLRGGVGLRVEPMHQVHDEFLTQFRAEGLEWATHKIKEWFNNPIRIAGVEVVIPFEGQYGVDWSMNEHSKRGSI